MVGGPLVRVLWRVCYDHGQAAERQLALKTNNFLASFRKRCAPRQPASWQPQVTGAHSERCAARLPVLSRRRRRPVTLARGPCGLGLRDSLNLNSARNWLLTGGNSGANNPRAQPVSRCRSSPGQKGYGRSAHPHRSVPKIPGTHPAPLTREGQVRTSLVFGPRPSRTPTALRGSAGCICPLLRGIGWFSSATRRSSAASIAVPSSTGHPKAVGNACLWLLRCGCFFQPLHRRSKQKPGDGKTWSAKFVIARALSRNLAPVGASTHNATS